LIRKSKKRALTEAEHSLWARVVETAEPIRPGISSIVQTLDPPEHRPYPTPARLRPFQIGEAPKKTAPSHHLQPDLDERFAKVSPNMDKRNFDRLKKGKLKVDGKLDLHGMNLAQAHPALNRFVRDSHSSGKRLLLVITGKGNSSRNQDDIMPARRGILKHQVPQWLTMAPLAPMVLQVTQATQKHGGTGAYYVYLRRQR
jgi:DNA-nicking Smr family endonuclease